jgi:hypothetical protein
MDDQSMRLYNLNPAWGGSSIFGIDLNKGGEADELEDQVVRGFVWCERVNRVDHHNDLCHDPEKYQKATNLTREKSRFPQLIRFVLGWWRRTAVFLVQQGESC